MTKLRFTTIALAVLALLILIQLVPIHRDNPPVTGAVRPPAPVAALLKRSCFDCHSHETQWPWYSYVAPMSWLVARDVHTGREHLNFSQWKDYSNDDMWKKLAGISDMVQQREMPLWFYLLLHSDAKLTDDEVSEIATWADTYSDEE